MKTKMKNRLLGFIGAFIGGFICTIPWILVYVCGNMLFSVLATFIAYGSLLGYKKLGGNVDKKTPLIIVFVSLIVIIITTLIIIPLCLLYKEGYVVNFHNLEVIYNMSQFRNGIIHDLIISVFFTCLGISGVISKLKQEVNFDYVAVQNSNRDNIDSVKKSFMKYHAMDKFNATSKEKILLEINNNIELFNQLRMQQIIKKYRGNYYFSEKAENSILYRFAILYFKITGILLICSLLVFILFTVFD